MSTYIHGIAASENIDSSGEIVSIAGMDISSLEREGTFNYEHEVGKAPDKDGKMVDLQIKVPSQTVGKILKAKKIFSETDCEDEHQLAFWHKVKTAYLYVMGELFDDYTDAAKDLAGKFRYDADKAGINERTVNNFSIEGVRIPDSKKDMMVMRSIARKVTITVTPCNKAAVATIMPAKRKAEDINSLFKTEEVEIEIFKGEVALKKEMGISEASGALSGGAPTSPSLMGAEELKKDQPKLTVAPPAPKAIGSTKSGKSVLPNARIHEYKDFSHQDHKDATEVHLKLAGHYGSKGDHNKAKFHQGKGLLHNQAANTMIDRQARLAAAPKKAAIAPPSPRAKSLFDPKLSTNPLKKALDAGSGMAAPSQLEGGAALAIGFGPKKKKKEKSKWLTVAEAEYQNWEKREMFETFMAKKMPHLTKGEIKAIGQTIALKKSQDMESALASLTSFEPLEKKAGKDSVYTLLLFEGCDLPDVLHCSHFATDDTTGETAQKIKEVCDQYFQGKTASHDLKFEKQGTLGKEGQPVLFLTDGDPYKDLFEKLKEVAEYKYPEFKPHVSVTSNVDAFKGKVAKLVISINGEVKYTYDIK